MSAQHRGRPGGPHHFGPPMAMPGEKARDFRGTLRRLLAYLRPRAWQLGAVLLLAVLSTVFSIISPKIMGKATTKLFEGLMAKYLGLPGAGVDFAYIGRILVLLIVLYLISAAFGYAQQYIMAGIAQKTVYDLRNRVNDKLARLPLKFFDSRTHGEVLSRVTNDIDTIASTLQQSLTQLITAIVTLIGVVVMMLSISPLLTLVTLVTLPLSAVVTVGAARRSQKFFAAFQKSLGELNGHVEEVFTGHPVVKAYGRQAEAVATFDGINQRLYEAGWKSQFVSGMLFPLMGLVNNIGYVIVAVVGGVLVTRRAIEIGDIQAFIQYSRQFGQPIAQTANIANIIQSTIAAAERVFELLDEAEEVADPADAVVLPSPRGEVRFENVRFSYKPDEPLIEDLSLTARPGQVVAIVGPTGAGKTTLINLLMRFYDVDGGRITIDGVDIRRMRRRDLRALFGMVLQDTWLFSGTIRENIAYGREGATEEEIVQAARLAHADAFIRSLPQGYDTVLNEEASNISQGQRQLLTIARAFLANPPMLILDEATSSVDTRTELLIQRAMQSLMRGRTSFVIAHRLSTIRDADLILVMEHGRIVEQGTHRELLEAGGHYAELYNSQFAGSEPA
ncbi:ABC transporter ATP-binding protein [Symbiobacterium terraclitae]|uniref:ABC transporter ATP-binding protein n=1 Tax=Symbiobacterium terraclitae TaxID=557451 RepID=UPI0035B50BEA